MSLTSLRLICPVCHPACILQLKLYVLHVGCQPGGALAFSKANIFRASTDQDESGAVLVRRSPFPGLWWLFVARGPDHR